MVLKVLAAVSQGHYRRERIQKGRLGTVLQEHDTEEFCLHYSFQCIQEKSKTRSLDLVITTGHICKAEGRTKHVQNC